MKRLFFTLTMLITMTIPGYAMENPNDTNTKVTIDQSLIRPNFPVTRKEPAQELRPQLLSGTAGKQEIVTDFNKETLPDYLAALSDGDKEIASQKSKDWPSYVGQLQKIWRSKANKDIFFGLHAITSDNQKEIINKVDHQFPMAEIIAQAAFAAGDMPSFTIDAKTLGATPTGAICIIDDTTAYIGCTNGSILEYDLKKKIITSKAITPVTNSPVTALAIQNQWFVAGYKDGTINIENGVNASQSFSIIHGCAIIAIALSPDNKLACYDKNGQLSIYDFILRTHTIYRTIHQADDAELVFLENGTLLCITYNDPTIYTINPNNHTSLEITPHKPWYVSTIANKNYKSLNCSNDTITIANLIDQTTATVPALAHAIAAKINNLRNNMRLIASPLFIAYLSMDIIQANFGISPISTAFAIIAIGTPVIYCSNFFEKHISPLFEKQFLRNALPLHLVNTDTIDVPLAVLNGAYYQKLVFFNKKHQVTAQKNIADIKKAKIMHGYLVLTKDNDSIEIIDLNEGIIKKTEQFFSDQLNVAEWELMHKINNAFTKNIKISLSHTEQCTYQTLLTKIENQFNAQVADAVDKECNKYSLPALATNTACNIV